MTDSNLTAGDDQLLTAFMQRLHTTPVGVASQLPGADVLLLKAQLLRRWEAQRKAQRPMELMEPVEIAAGLAAAMLLLSWTVPSAFAWIPRLLF
jgi:hypothetical protein